MFADGPVEGLTVLVHGAWAVSEACGAACPVGRSESHRHRAEKRRPEAREPGCTHAMALDHPDPAAAIRALAVDGVDRVIEVSFSDNVDLDAAV